MTTAQIPNPGILIAEYTLGLLNLQETAQAQALLGRDSQAAIAALKWENRFLELVDLLPPVHPGPQTLQQLQAALGHAPVPLKHPAPSAAAVEKAAPPRPDTREHVPIKSEHDMLTVAAALRTREKNTAIPQSEIATEAAAPRAHVPAAKPEDQSEAKTSPQDQQAPAQLVKNNVWVWRLASLVFALIALTLALMPAKPSVPPVTVVEVAPTRAAIMQAPGLSSTPAWIVTINPKGDVLLDPQVRSDIPADASVQLWTHNKDMPQPRSLGLIDPNQPVTVPASLMGEISPDQIFEMTQEPAGGSATASPSGPILFIGRIVTFGKPAALAPPAGEAPAGNAPAGQ